MEKHRSTFLNCLARAFLPQIQSEGAAEGGCGGNSAAPERSAGAKRRRASSLQNGFAQSLEYPTKFITFPTSSPVEAGGNSTLPRHHCFHLYHQMTAPLYYSSSYYDQDQISLDHSTERLSDSL